MESLEYKHIPVMLKEVVELLNLREDSVVVDATCGEGGHSVEIIKRIPKGILVCIDIDRDILEIAKKRLENYKNVFFYNTNFYNIREVLFDVGVDKADAILFDLGMSSYHLESGRGFSIRHREDLLDMRYSPRYKENAIHILNTYSFKELYKIIREYGEEFFAYRIAKGIVEKRKEKGIKTVGDLVDIIIKSLPKKFKEDRKIHPATKTFMALRIYINRELENLEKALKDLPNVLKEGGRVAFLTFHSLEDRLVKKYFEEFEKKGLLKIITKKPILPTEEEKRNNPRSRSAKLRVAEKL